MQELARRDTESALQTAKSLKSIFEAFLRSSFLLSDSEKRGQTSIAGPRSFSFRPASARQRVIPTPLSLRNLFQNCLSVCQGLMRAIGLFKELREMINDPAFQLSGRGSAGDIYRV